MRALLLAAALASGCYQPNAPSGSYLCAADDACPDGLACHCGLCVSAPEQAACSFVISSSQAKPAPTGKGRFELPVMEHELFEITVIAQAVSAAGVTVPSTFSGPVTLSSTWGDVCVGTNGCATLPNQVTLDNGKATTMIQLNRETILPQSAVLRASFAGNVGTSGELKIEVSSPVFTREPAPIIAPLMSNATFGFAQFFVGAPSVVKTQSGWNMYFLGGVQRGVSAVAALGMATSTDGKTFSPMSTPIFTGTLMTGGGIGTPSAYLHGGGVTIYLGQKGLGTTFSTIASVSASSPDGPFPDTTTTVLQLDDCPYCTNYDAPTVIADPDPSLSGGGPDAAIMFFSGQQKDVTGASFASVVRAQSLDGATFEVDPSPLITGDTQSETFIFSPRVILDGKTFKMFYSYTSQPLTSNGVVPTGCRPSTTIPYVVGYATSSDGYTWIRSPHNASGGTPVLDMDTAQNAWDVGDSLLVSSVVAADGVDPSTGLILYYDPVMPAEGNVSVCLPNGIGRATRP